MLREKYGLLINGQNNGIWVFVLGFFQDRTWLLRLKLGDYGLIHNWVGLKGLTNSKDGLYHFPKDVLPRISPQMILDQVLKSREILDIMISLYFFSKPSIIGQQGYMRLVLDLVQTYS